MNRFEDAVRLRSFLTPDNLLRENGSTPIMALNLYRRSLALFALLFVSATTPAGWLCAEDVPRMQAREAMLKAANFFRTQVANQGGYVFRYSSDLKLAEGEEKVGPSMVWIQPPATPAVGMAYLEAYRATKEKSLLDAAKETAMCLVKGQLTSGGWYNSIELDPKLRQEIAYRVDGTKKPKAKNLTTLDDNKTQSCCLFLAQLDRELGFQNPVIHEASLYVLDSLLKAQYPNGAWPQGYSEPPNPKDFPVKQASYPDTWSRTFPAIDYKGFYTLNDNTHVDTLKLMLSAFQVYGDERYKAAAIKGGEFLLLAQMPDPQPAWAQQYDLDMHPAWARKFEPPAVSGSESQKIVETLTYLYQETGDKRFLESGRRALKYLSTCVLPSKNLARFYELKANKPLFFTKDYKLTYDDSDVPTHYGFIVKNGLDKLEEKMTRIAAIDPTKLAEYAARQHLPKKIEPSNSKDVAKVIKAMDARGAWVENGKMSTHKNVDVNQIIDTKTFIKNLDILARYDADN